MFKKMFSNNFNKIILIFIIIFIILLFLTFFWFFYQPNRQMEVDFLDVGQGDAILIKTSGGQNVLIDGGPDRRIIKRLGENLNWWDGQIDLMVLTHPHDDHVSGLIDVIKKYRVKKIIYSGVVSNSPNYLAWLKLVLDKKINLTIINRPQIIKLSDGCQLEIIYPQESLLGLEMGNLNNSSLIIRMVYGKTKFLFVGDAEEQVEVKLLNSKVDLTADVLKVGHHGSDTSSGQRFLEKINPRIAVIEVGKDNTFGQPNLRIIKRLERLGAKVLRTDQLGTIKLFSDQQKVY
ncbi:MAG: ComEC/Rec2 family competence protein [Patescibacteria group bacterium]